jgi:hypothetical protein
VAGSLARRRTVVVPLGQVGRARGLALQRAALAPEVLAATADPDIGSSDLYAMKKKKKREK